MKSHLRRLRRRRRFLGYYLLGLLGLLSRAPGSGMQRRCGHALGRASLCFGAETRRDLERQLPRTLGASTGRDAARAILRDAFRYNTRAVLELAAMYFRRIPDAELRELCRVEGLGALRDALGQGRGVVLLGLHMGNGALMLARLAIEGIPVSIVTSQERRSRPHDYLSRALHPYGVEVIASRRPRDAARRQRGGKAYESLIRAQAFTEVRRALTRGRVVFVLMDQFSKNTPDHFPFLGKCLPLPVGPAELARRSEAPVLAALPLAAEPQWRFRFEPAPQPDPKATPQANTAALARMLDAHIRAYPQLWTWDQRYWRHYPFMEPDEVTPAAPDAVEASRSRALIRVG